MAPLRLTAIRAGARAARPTWSIATNIATPTSTTTTHTGHTQATSRAPRHTLPSRLSSHPRRCLHSTCTMSLATADDCTCSCPSHGGVPDRGLSTSPFNAPPGVANQVPFHSHALVGSTTGANAYAHHQPMRGYNQATTGPMSPTGKQGQTDSSRWARRMRCQTGVTEDPTLNIALLRICLLALLSVSASSQWEILSAVCRLAPRRTRPHRRRPPPTSPRR